MTGKEVRQALLRGDSVYGTAVLSTSPLWPGFIKSTGIDFVFIDTEHTPIERHTLSWICHTYRALGLPPMVRIPEPDPYQACMVLDGGACGVLAPYIETPEQVRALVGAVRVAITGLPVGFGLYETMGVLGRPEVLKRIDHALATYCQ